jgi:hypothetical protein
MSVFCNDAGDAVGTIGVDFLDFDYRGGRLRLGFSNNYHAIESGVGGLLYLKWIRAAAMGIVFGGSEDTHKILRQQRWTYYSGIRTLFLNWPYEPSPGEPGWRAAAKAAARFATHRRLTSFASRLPSFSSEVDVLEEAELSADMLPATSPFVFRFAPSLEYLNWRYATNLSFVRYRVFRISVAGATRGYVILNDQPDRLLIAQADSDDVRVLAAGVLKGLLIAAAHDEKPRTAMMTCSHLELLRIFSDFGFVPSVQERPWVLGSAKRKVDIDADTSEWLINFDIGDNGLRYPFTDSLKD